MNRLFIILISILTIPQVACASFRPSVAGGYEIQLEDPSGNRLNTYRHSGTAYVLGHYGNRYNIRVFNRTNQRIEAVVTVDGRDSISGDVGDFVRQRGYVIDPYDSVLVEGFRRSMSQVAAFRFTTPGDSYAGRRGTAHNVGVVGVAIFKERYRRPHYGYHQPRPPVGFPRRDSYGGSRLGSAPQAEAPSAADSMGTRRSRAAKRSYRRHRRPQQNRLGTRYGENQYSNAVEVAFRRASKRRPNQILSVYYDDQAGLAARGIHVGHGYVQEPSPFPNRRFAPPPR